MPRSVRPAMRSSTAGARAGATPDRQPEPHSGLLGVACLERGATEVELLLAGRQVVAPSSRPPGLHLGGPVAVEAGAVRRAGGLPQADRGGVRLLAQGGLPRPRRPRRRGGSGRRWPRWPRRADADGGAPPTRAARRVEHRGRRRRRGRRHPAARPRRVACPRTARRSSRRGLHRLVGEAPGLGRATAGGRRLGRDDERQERTVLVVAARPRPPRRRRRCRRSASAPRRGRRSPASSSASRPASVSSSARASASEPRRRCSRARTRSGSRVVDPARLDRAHQDGSRRCRSSPRR